MRVGARLGLVASLAAVVLGTVETASAMPRTCLPGALGVHREIAIDAKGGPRYGHQQYPGPEILEAREVVLTFDDGPHKLYTKPILDEIGRAHV